LNNWAIIGAGLAGTTFAWQLRRAGLPFQLFDQSHISSSSRVAAGLITPVTGLRLAKSWQYEMLWPVAADFYRSIEREIGESILHEHSALRLFQNDSERDLAIKKSDRNLKADHAIGDFVRWPTSIPDSLHAPRGGIELTPAAFLDIPRYLDQSHLLMSVIHERFQPDQIREFRHVVFCEGFSTTPNSFFPEFSFNPTKGEILTIACPDLNVPFTIHGAGWIRPIPARPHHYLAGTTYDRDTIDCIPTDRGRDDIERKLRMMLNVPFHVVDHVAGIRPTIRESQPTIARHPLHRHIAYFNGLGSKGALAAPYYARSLFAILSDPTSES
jgi:glycine oxidase